MKASAFGRNKNDLIYDCFLRLPLKIKGAAFMKESYAYCKAHEAEIRNHIHKSES